MTEVVVVVVVATVAAIAMGFIIIIK